MAPNIVDIFGVNIGTPYIMTFMDDGSAFVYNVASAVVTQIATGGTFSFTGIGDIAIWQGQTVLIVDPATGYFRWPGAAAGSTAAIPQIISAPTIADAGAGNVDAGSHQWAVTWVIAGSETNPGARSVTLTLSAA